MSGQGNGEEAFRACLRVVTPIIVNAARTNANWAHSLNDSPPDSL